MTAKIRHWPWVVMILAFVFMLPEAPPAAADSLPAVLAADRVPLSPEQMQAGSLLLKMKSGYTVATRVNTDIGVEVNGPIARTTLKQTFRNDGTQWVEAVYVFPLPDRAAVDRLRMQIGDHIIEGEIRAKEEAKKTYEAARNAGHGAGLVEQQRANLFTVSVANLGPGTTITIEIAYLETLPYEDGTFSLRIPLTFTPRYIPGASLPDRQGSGWSADTDQVPDASLITPPVVTTASDHKVTLHAEIDAGVPLEFIRSRYHPIDVSPVDVSSTGDGDNRYVVELNGKPFPLDHDLELVWKPVADSVPRAALFSETIDGRPHYLLMVLPPSPESPPPAPMPRDLVVVIDTSGSMFGTSIEQARAAVLLALDGLRLTDRFNVIQFNSVTKSLFDTSVPASAANIDRAKRYVRGLEANGGTEMGPALALALAEPVSEPWLKQVIFVTDGSVGNESALYSLIDAQLGAARLFTIGIGSAPNSWFMRKAAEAGRGSYTFISALHEVKEKMGRLFEKLEQPQVTDIRVEWPNGDTLAYPETVPDLYAGEPVVVKARAPLPPRDGDLVRVSGDSPSGRWSTDLALASTRQNAGIATVWGRARIENLLDRERRGEDAEGTRAAVLDTALEYHLVSPYTSLVAVDKTPLRPDSADLTQEQVPSLLPYGQSQRAIFGFPPTATGWRMHLASGIVMLILALLLLAFGGVVRRGLRSDVVAAR